jgi:hypothetical protein
LGTQQAQIEIESFESVEGRLCEYDWTVYSHPTEGWQVTKLVVTEATSSRDDDRLLCDCDADDNGDAAFVEWIGANNDATYHEWLNEIEARMYEFGKSGVAREIEQREPEYELTAEFVREEAT